MKGFTKISLESGEEKTVKFQLNYADLTFINKDLDRVAETGKFTVFIESLKADFTLNNVPTTTTTTTTTVSANKPTTTTTSGGASIASNSFFIFKIEFTLLAAICFILKN